ncbi:serine/threonine-protein kinase [Streptomyces sp. NRRL S-1824]|uniref:serine/threonine-protein kinase n=1 Tax=Streptomyces sp. NRRL S-1824 TaxID=1463889 RepID=UPI0004CBA818|nr:serine/threonine-protein kinase [Streptomyces sp. NRRL S-1824]
MDKLGSGDPQRIGAYRLLGRLGAGGMGQVYLARSDRGRTVAIKLVRRELAEQQEFRDRFRQEVRAARRVGSAWTAPVLDADTEAAVPWVATGYVAGPSLQATVSGRPGAPAGPGAYGPLPERSVRILGAGLARALRSIHAAGLIHRDLKPSNILLTIDGPRVIDFGIARALDTVTDGGLTRTGSLVGSPGFMAPEQVRGERVTAACDVFCLGSVLAYASTGRLPFSGADNEVHALLFRIAQEEPDLTGVPVDLADLVRDCLRKDPADRPTTDAILERLVEGETAEPWLPGALIAQLGRHAVELLDSEDPEESAGAAGPQDAVPPVDDSQPPSAQAPGAVHALPTVVGTQPPAPAPAPHPVPGFGPPPPGPPPPGQPALGYGYPQLPAPPHPGQGYGYPQQHPGFGSTPPYGPLHPTVAPGAQPAPTRRSTGSTIALVAVAVLVAIGAGGSVYALMSDDGKKPAASPTASPTASADPSDSPAPDDSPSSVGPPPGEESKNGDGPIPEAYLGTWSGAIDNAAGHSTRELVIQQGKVGQAVLALTAEGPIDGGGTYRCVFQADLTSEPSPDEPIHIGPSTVTLGEPMSSCTPGKATTLTLLPDGTLRRENTETGEQLTYTKSD